MTEITPALPITVRFFAAARAVAGTESSILMVAPGSTVSDAIRELCGQSDDLALVLQKCSYLCDGYAVRDPGTKLRAHQTLDVLPPFAGG